MEENWGERQCLKPYNCFHCLLGRDRVSTAWHARPFVRRSPPALSTPFSTFSSYSTRNCSPPLCLRNSYSSFKTQSSIAFFYCPSSGQLLSVLENALAQTVSIPGVGSEDWTHSQKRAWPYKGLSVSGAEVGTVLLEGPTLVHTSCTAQLTLFSTYSVPDLVF